MTSNSPPEEQNKLSVYHVNTAASSGADFNNPASPCTAWRSWYPRCLEEQSCAHTLPARPAREAVSAGGAHSWNKTRQEGTRSVPDSQSLTWFSIPAGWCLGDQHIRRERKKSSPLFLFSLGFIETKIAPGAQDTTVAVGHRICLLLLN